MITAKLGTHLWGLSDLSRRNFCEDGSEASAKKLGTRLSQMPLAVRD